jgi:hypothetical protein
MGMPYQVLLEPLEVLQQRNIFQVTMDVRNLLHGILHEILLFQGYIAGVYFDFGLWLLEKVPQVANIEPLPV